MRTAALAVLLTLLSGPVMLASAASAPQVSRVPTPSRTLSRRSDSPSGGGYLLNPVDISLKAMKMADAVPMTNAQRLKRGLSPNRPNFYRSGMIILGIRNTITDSSWSARSLAARASAAPNPNPGCATRTGTLLVTGTGVPLGTVVSRLPNEFGEYGITADAEDALQVQYADCGNNLPVDLITLVSVL